MAKLWNIVIRLIISKYWKFSTKLSLKCIFLKMTIVTKFLFNVSFEHIRRKLFFKWECRFNKKHLKTKSLHILRGKLMGCARFERIEKLWTRMCPWRICYEIIWMLNVGASTTEEFNENVGATAENSSITQLVSRFNIVL